jgi:hypothetical protein
LVSAQISFGAATAAMVSAGIESEKMGDNMDSHGYYMPLGIGVKPLKYISNR